jgi:hypothetical protein
LYWNRLGIIGIFLVLFGILVYFTGFLDGIVTSIFWFLVLGSSEGKSILFLVIMGSLLILNSLIVAGNSSKFALGNVSTANKYLKYTLILILFTYAVGLIIEIWLRLQYGASIFTVFISLKPDISSTSIIHSHVFKSALGQIITNLGANIPSNIHTGDSLSPFLSPATYIILFTLPLTYFTGLLSMDKRMDHYKLIMAFALSLSLVGMIDGGLFSQPAIIGFAGLLGMYFIKKPFFPRNLIKPTIIVFLLIMAGLFLEIAGSNPDYHQITVINQKEPVDMGGYKGISTNSVGVNIININSTENDKNTFVSLFETFKGKADGFFITWNFYSYF